MKNYSRTPTEENVLELLKRNPIGRTEDVLRFVELLSNMEDACYSIALNGEWGSGKTFFVKQVQLILDAQNLQSSISEETRTEIKGIVQNQPSVPDSYTSVYYDAWANDNHEDPLLSLIYEVIHSGQSSYTPERERNLCTAISNIADLLTGRNVSDVLNDLRGKDKLENIQKEASLKELVREFINNLIEEHGNRLIIFVDELDRCKPDYAIRFLERIKHYFDDDRVTFVFSVSLSQLQWTVKSYYGTEFNATRYLDKFFDIQLTLPRVNYNVFLKNWLCVWDDSLVALVGVEVIKYFIFSLRETERYIRLLKIIEHAAKNIFEGFEEQNAVLFSATYFAPIMVGLQMCDMKAYNAFVSGEDYGPMKEILINSNVLLHGRLLLNSGEQYGKDGAIVDRTGKPVDTVTERVEKTYKALFGRNYSEYGRSTTIGRMSFTEKVRIDVERIAAIISPFEEYDIE